MQEQVVEEEEGEGVREDLVQQEREHVRRAEGASPFVEESSAAAEDAPSLKKSTQYNIS
jgi:hypothetical protein